ncbi:MAG TPA: biotin/lipoate A/B protein ligase family protein [Candidatus Dormibacteraeota bacterium]|nr:biotin/lipoate A/B protein ligase family protein [Candidatus Dormibacteraeota bacterium]
MDLAGLAWQVIMPRPLPPHLQMALEEVLLERVAAGERGPTLRFWEWSEPALVLGCNQVLANEVDLDAARRLGFVVARRLSGGGTMIVEPGRTITYSLYAPDRLVAGMSFVDSFAHLDAWTVECLRSLGVPARHRPINDIAAPEGKIGGAAQARRRGCVLHHTAIAHRMDTGLVRRLIRLGRPPVSSRGVRSADRAVAPLSLWLDLDRDEVVTALAACFRERTGAIEGELTAGELAEAGALTRRRYATADWIDRLR